MSDKRETSAGAGRLHAALAGCALGLLVGYPAHAQVSIANAPLFLTSGVEPNVLFVIDDSGSMQWETMDDDTTKIFGGSSINNDYVMWTFPRVSGLHGASDYSNQRTVPFSGNTAAFFRSATNNTVYYNPAVTYRPWSNPDGSLMAAADPEAAPNRPLFPAFGTRNLTVDNSGSAAWVADNGNANTQTRTFYPAVYYHYDGTGNVRQESSYERVEIKPGNAPFTGHGRANRTDCTNGSCTYAQEMQNFANWYTYHRNRLFAARAGIGRAFSTLPEHVRVGYGTINKGATNIDGVSTSTVVSGVRPFGGSDRTSFFTELYERPVSTSGTPLRSALEGAGEYFRRTDSQGPWSTTPGQSGGQDLACRQSFTILMTDGYYNNDAPSSAIGNADGSNGPTISNPSGGVYQYVPADPYQDDRDATLADVAMYYWQRDLRTDLPNRVPVSPRDEAFWQHMVTYTVGLAVQGDVSPDDAVAAVAQGLPIAWGNPLPNDVTREKIDDMLHAAINSRGGFFSASDAETFAAELTNVLSDIVARVESSSTSAATSSAVLQTDTLLYTAGFRSTDWSGTLTASAIDSVTGTVGNIVWNAESVLAATQPALRNILTVNSQTGGTVQLDFDNLSDDQKSALDYGPSDSADGLGNARVEWLRGDDTVNAAFRSRNTPEGLRLLGDIVHSNPQFISKTDFGYSLLGTSEASGYSAFRASIQSRPDVIYVGANDGMLHAFDAEDGQELFAFMPSELLLPEPGRNHAPLSRLMDPNYEHRFFVDGTAAISDAYVDGEWKTVLVGTMGSGGRSVFALDVTDPTTPAVLWEFSHADLGYNVGRPTVVRMRNGEWAAVFGNGYNSDNHRAVLFVVELDTGDVLARIDTGVGSSGAPNGLAAPVVTDWPNGDLQASRVYAGDLLGNVWRFDVSASSASTWEASSSRAVVFSAVDSGGTAQPITSRPAIAPHPDVLGALVVSFGTGSYFRVEDGNLSSPQVQTLYGIIDDGSTAAARGDLLQQTITWQGTQTFTAPDGTQSTHELRTLSNNVLDPATHKGWYLDLIYDGNAAGERVVSSPTFPSGAVQNRVRFTSMIPGNDDPCGSARGGFLMDIDLRSGGRYHTTVFDLNLDGQFDLGDATANGPPSGVAFGAGELPTVIRQPNANREILYSGDGGEAVFGATEGFGGRQSWRQVR